MQFSITFRNMDSSEHLKNYARDKFSKLEKYLDSVLVADITLSVDKFRHKAEAVISADRLKIKGEEVSDDMYSSLDLLIDKVERQIKRSREKLKDYKVRRKASPEEDFSDNLDSEE